MMIQKQEIHEPHDNDDYMPDDSGGNDSQGPNNCVTEEAICKLNERLRDRNTTI